MELIFQNALLREVEHAKKQFEELQNEKVSAENKMHYFMPPMCSYMKMIMFIYENNFIY